MTDEELLKRMLALFSVIGGRVYYNFRDDISVGEKDAELEPHLIARLRASTAS